MTNEEYTQISQSLETCIDNIEKSFDRFNESIKSMFPNKYPDAFISEKEQQTHESTF